MSLFFTTLVFLVGFAFVGQREALGAPQSPKSPSASASDPLVWLPPAEIAARVSAPKDVTGSIDKERRPTPIDAAAFEELRAEVSALRRAVASLPAAAPTLGGVVKAIQGLERRLAIIETRRASTRGSSLRASNPL